MQNQDSGSFVTILSEKVTGSVGKTDDWKEQQSYNVDQNIDFGNGVSYKPGDTLQARVMETADAPSRYYIGKPGASNNDGITVSHSDFSNLLSQKFITLSQTSSRR